MIPSKLLLQFSSNWDSYPQTNVYIYHINTRINTPTVQQIHSSENRAETSFSNAFIIGNTSLLPQRAPATNYLHHYSPSSPVQYNARTYVIPGKEI